MSLQNSKLHVAPPAQGDSDTKQQRASFGLYHTRGQVQNTDYLEMQQS